MFDFVMNDTLVYHRWLSVDKYNVPVYKAPTVVKCFKEVSLKVVRVEGKEELSRVNFYILPSHMRGMTVNDLVDGVPVYTLYVVKIPGNIVTHVEVTTL